MPKVQIETLINAPIEHVFDAARDLHLHTQTTGKTREKIIGEKQTGLLELGESVTFEATHFGIRQQLSARITVMKAPHHFREEMTRGAFVSLIHDHYFEAYANQTLMRDVLNFRVPLGILGRVAEKVFLEDYMARFLTARGLALKTILENP